MPRSWIAGCDDFIAKPFRHEAVFDLIGRHLGLRYVYNDEIPASLPTTEISTREALASIPKELVDRLRRAVNEGDVTLAHEITSEIGVTNDALAAELRRLIRAYNFDQIQSLLGG